MTKQQQQKVSDQNFKEIVLEIFLIQIFTKLELLSVLFEFISIELFTSKELSSTTFSLERGLGIAL